MENTSITLQTDDGEFSVLRDNIILHGETNDGGCYVHVKDIGRIPISGTLTELKELLSQTPPKEYDEYEAVVSIPLEGPDFDEARYHEKDYDYIRDLVSAHGLDALDFGGLGTCELQTTIGVSREYIVVYLKLLLIKEFNVLGKALALVNAVKVVTVDPYYTLYHNKIINGQAGPRDQIKVLLWDGVGAGTPTIQNSDYADEYGGLVEFKQRLESLRSCIPEDAGLQLHVQEPYGVFGSLPNTPHNNQAIKDTCMHVYMFYSRLFRDGYLHSYKEGNIQNIMEYAPMFTLSGFRSALKTMHWRGWGGALIPIDDFMVEVTPSLLAFGFKDE